MRHPSFGAHALELCVQVRLDAIGRPLVVADLHVIGGVPPSTDEDLAGLQLPPVAITEIRVGRNCGQASGVGRGREHLRAAGLDCDFGKKLRCVCVGGEDHAAGSAFSAVGVDEHVGSGPCLDRGDVHTFANRSGRRLAGQGADDCGGIGLSIAQIHQDVAVP